jgi:hypothetical protein
MYLQVGSENGVLALYLFLGHPDSELEVLSLPSKRAGQIPPSEQLGLQRVAFALSASMVGFMVSGTFLTVAYDYFLCACTRPSRSDSTT